MRARASVRPSRSRRRSSTRPYCRVSPRPRRLSSTKPFIAPMPSRTPRPPVPVDLDETKGANHAHRQVARARRAARAAARVRPDEAQHDDRGRERDEGGRERVRVEHLEQLDVGGDERHQVALPLAFELGGGEARHRAEHPVAHQGEDLEGQVVVAQLLAVAQGPAHEAADRDERAHRAERDDAPRPRDVHDAVGGKHREEYGRTEAQHAEHDSENHDGDEGFFTRRTRRSMTERFDRGAGAASGARRAGCGRRGRPVARMPRRGVLGRGRPRARRRLARPPPGPPPAPPRPAPPPLRGCAPQTVRDPPAAPTGARRRRPARTARRACPSPPGGPPAARRCSRRSGSPPDGARS